MNCNDVVQNPKNNLNSCENFLQIILTAHTLSAACKILKISNLDDQPSASAIGIASPENLWSCTNDKKKAILNKISKTIVKEFITFSFNDTPNNTHTDEDHRYTCNFLNIGCFYLAYKDAIREGDGRRVLESWHYFISVFHNAGRRNYANEAFIFLTQYFYDLPTQQAQQLLYSRFVNTAGVRG